VAPLVPPPSHASTVSSSTPPAQLPPDTASIDTMIKSMHKSPDSSPPVSTVPAPDTVSVINTPPPAQQFHTVHTNMQPATAMAQGQPEHSLSAQSKDVLKGIPPDIDRKKPVPGPLIEVAHVKNAPATTPAESEVKTVKHDGVSISIGKKAPKIDANYRLEEAYEALASGQTSEAVEIYKSVLSNDPNNKDALFALATTYHRVGQMDMARPLYAKLLTVDPKNREGLNNYLALLAEEAPRESLAQLAELEARDPRFSPIPAQMAIIYEKMGDFDKASAKMFRAVELAPENMSYRYNLAIMLDKQKKYDEAARFYSDVVKAWQRGETVPGDIKKIQQRLAFIASASGREALTSM
jgi:Tfp pilus assembly protein PilF